VIEIVKISESAYKELCKKKGKPFCELINELDPPEIYTIMTAIRGCDFSLPIHKRIFTARIRYLVFGHNAWGIIRDEAKLTINKIIGLIFEAFLMSLMNREDEYMHYINHICDALNILEDSEVFKEEEKEIRWLRILSINLKEIGEFHYYDAIKDIRELIAKYVNLDEEAYTRIMLKRSTDEKSEVLVRKETTLREVFSSDFLSSIIEAFQEYEKALKYKGEHLPVVDFVVCPDLDGVSVTVSNKYDTFPKLFISVDIGEEGYKKWRPSI